MDVFGIPKINPCPVQFYNHTFCKPPNYYDKSRHFLEIISIISEYHKYGTAFHDTKTKILPERLRWMTSESCFKKCGEFLPPKSVHKPDQSSNDQKSVNSTE